MKYSGVLFWLSILVAVIALITSVAGLFWVDGGQPVDFTTIHGEQVQLYGKGVYRFETAFKAPIYRGADAIILFLGIPILAFAVAWYRRGSIRGGFLLAGMLACFFYNFFSVTFGAAYNSFYLLYVAGFSTSLYALVTAFRLVDYQGLSGRIKDNFPYRGLAIFLFISGLSPAVWLIDIISSLVSGGVPPLLGCYTTDVTTAFDVGVITPACMIAGVYLLKRRPLGNPLATVLLTLLSMIGLIVAGQSVMQYLDGIRLSNAEILAFVVPFVSLSLVAAWLVSLVLRRLSETVEH